MGLNFKDRGQTGATLIISISLYKMGPFTKILLSRLPRGVDTMIPSPQKSVK